MLFRLRPKTAASAALRYMWAPILFKLHDGTPSEMQGAIHRVSLRSNQPALHIWRQPQLHRRCEPAQQSNTGGAAFYQAADEFVDLFCGFPDNPPRYLITSVRMSHHQGSEGCVVRGGSVIHPGNGLEWIVVKAHHHLMREVCDD